MVVARAMVNRATADELRDACMAVALKLGGWDGRGRPKSGRPGRLRSRQEQRDS
jgi:TetR/AcrR family transcriptional regulator, transcriptional repressor for nem operon